MNNRIIAGVALSASAALSFFCDVGMQEARAAPPPAPASEQCRKALNDATVDNGYRLRLPGEAKSDDITVSLNDRIAVKITGFADYQKNCGAQTVLFLNGYPIKSLKPYSSSPTPPLSPAAASPNTGEFYFALNVTDDSRSSWTPILGRPCCSAPFVAVSIGLEDQYPLQPSAGKNLPVFKLDILGNRWFVIWAVLFVGMVGVFFWCVRNTNIIRDGNPATAALGVKGAYSLSKSQGALWFFVILASYLFIGLVTGDVTNSINSTALILLGIGAGTVIGSAVIDASKQNQDAAKTANDIAATKAKLTQLDQDIDAIDKQLSAVPPPANVDELKKQRLEKESEKEQALSAYRKLTGQNEQFLTDILSDADGVSFHRFQMAAWTLVLSIIFIKGVYENLAMPEFNTTLMGLLGLSAGTYLGLKIPEATTPKK